MSNETNIVSGQTPDSSKRRWLRFSSAGAKSKRPRTSYSPLLRWTWIAFLFVYLFSMIMTLFEVDAFQTLAAQLSRQGEGAAARTEAIHQREVLEAVREVAQERGDGGQTVPIDRPPSGGRARDLDTLRQAVRLLDAVMPELRFAPFAPDAARQADAAQDLLTRIGELSARLQQDRNTLPSCDKGDCGDAIAAKTLAVQLAGVRGQVGALLNSLQTLGLPNQGGANLNTTVTNAKSALESLQTSLGALGTTAGDALDTIMVRDLSASISDGLKALQRSGVDDLAALFAATADLGSPGSKGKKNDPLKPVGQTMSKDVRDALFAFGIKEGKGWTRASLDQENGLKSALTGFQQAKGLTVGDYGPKTATALTQFVADCNADRQCNLINADADDSGEVAGESARRELTRLAAALDALGTVATASQDGAAVADRARALADLDLAALRLSSLRILGPAEGAGGTVTAVAQSRERYEKAVAAIDRAVKALRQGFADESGLMPIVLAIGEDDPRAYQKAESIWNEYEAIDHYQSLLAPLAFMSVDKPLACDGYQPQVGILPLLNSFTCPVRELLRPLWNRLVTIGFHPKVLATMPRQALDILVVMVMGAVGSLIYLTRYLLNKVLQGIDESSSLWRPFSWYFFRPAFGMVVAFAIFLLYKTGQVALGGPTGNVLASEVNLPILAIVSLYAGLMSWQALELVESKGRRWLSDQTRDNLWAVGLEQALATKGKSGADLVAQVGVSPTQVERWIGLQDKVTPEMQDRILTWLERERVEIFSRDELVAADQAKLAWAVGLKDVIARHPAVGDVPQLAQLIGREVSTVQAWVDLKRQVPSDAQYVIADALGMPWALLFDPQLPDAHIYAVGLRKALAASDAKHATAQSLAQAVGSTQGAIRGYMELRSPVPKVLHERIAAALGLDAKALFSANRPLDAEFKWAHGLRRRMRKATPPLTSGALAEAIDTDQAYVRDWMELARCGEDDAPYCGQVPPETQKALLKMLGGDASALFRTERAETEFRWARMPALAQVIGNDSNQWADRLDVPPSRIERWLKGEERIAPSTQEALLEALNLPIESAPDYFTAEPPRQKAPEQDQGNWWATGLRQAVRENSAIASLSALAERLQLSPTTIYDIADLLVPVQSGLRERIRTLLGTSTATGKPVFGTERPAWSDYRWAPGLRQAMSDAKLGCAALARALDTEPARVRDWMEQEVADASAADPAAGLKVGQVPPELQPRIIEAINAAAEPAVADVWAERIFSPEPMDTGARYARRPALEIAITTQPDGLPAFAEQLDIDMPRLNRWLAQEQKILSPTQSAILALLGLTAAERDQIFTDTKGIDTVIG